MGKKLASMLNKAIDSATSEGANRSDTIARVAKAGGIAAGTLGQILSGDINCPPTRRISGFAKALSGINVSGMQTAMNGDGCNVTEAGLAEKIDIPEMMFDNIDLQNRVIELELAIEAADKPAEPKADEPTKEQVVEEAAQLLSRMSGMANRQPPAPELNPSQTPTINS